QPAHRPHSRLPRKRASHDLLFSLFEPLNRPARSVTETQPPTPARVALSSEAVPASPEHNSRHPMFVISGGEKAKARDILNAVRVLKAIEHERRPATPEEQERLARFAGFGPIALSIFPDPITGRYKNARWQILAEELRSLLTPEEYDSAKRTTFNAFYTSAT